MNPMPNISGLIEKSGASSSSVPEATGAVPISFLYWSRRDEAKSLYFCCRPSTATETPSAETETSRANWPAIASAQAAAAISGESYTVSRRAMT